MKDIPRRYFFPTFTLELLSIDGPKLNFRASKVKTYAEMVIAFSSKGILPSEYNLYYTNKPEYKLAITTLWTLEALDLNEKETVALTPHIESQTKGGTF